MGGQGVPDGLHLARMQDESDWLYRPAVEGMCRYPELRDGTLDLNDVATMNELLDIRVENTRRIKAYWAKNT